MFPIHDDTERMHGRPYLNYGMIAINVIVFIWEASVTSFFSDPSATEDLFMTYGAVPSKIVNDFPSSAPTIITSMFMHGGIAHIIGNMVFLFVFGDNIEDRYGRIKYILIYLGWGAAAALAHSFYAVSTGQGEIPAVGASGAISGVLGAYLVMYPRANILTIIAVFFIYTVRIPVLIYIPFWFIMQLIFALIGQLGPSGEAGVAYLAHIGGFVAGALTGLAWKALPNSIKYKEAPKKVQVKPVFRNPMARSVRPRIEDVVPATPEVIEGPDYYEVIAEMRGVLDASDISATYEAETRELRIIAHGTRRYELLAKLPDTAAANPLVKDIQYVNGIARIRLSKN
ncbi:MAG: rhomboid family intramembrane serine protease [Thermoproteota archaeon]|nr:rhomboid family intramembrane serine protease [Thermoproteota archaeon]MDQ3806745.1 rhomboid family intramembrane serine protease [Thermoproteota archaeon]